MGLADDLLKQANHLATKEKRRPQQASLRRAISTAYYALFHLLSSEASDKLIPHNPAKLVKFARRALAHTDMKNAAKGISQTPLGRPYNEVLTAPIPPSLVSVARAFVDLQEERHAADYDLCKTFDRYQVLALVKRAEDAFRDWNTVCATREASVFLTMLSLWKPLSNR
jgi:hypothetical protein